ncbi:MarR family transcriptional regulator [Solibacillus sp. CAU 1738]|uniref:MarR family winged helix-turn-helix transcriptional regulator n=1 Tax=Solibacillus sp. CAU 1738 TaxID=3140363 RepID=UPI0032604814
MELVDEKLRAITVILRAARSIEDVVRKDVTCYGLNTTEFAVLEALYHKGDLPIQIISKKILIASSSITYVVDKLEQKNLVRRSGCANDRRITYASLTEQGHTLMDDIFPKHKAKMAQLFNDMEEQSLHDMNEALKQIGIKSQSL